MLPVREQILTTQIPSRRVSSRSRAIIAVTTRFRINSNKIRTTNEFRRRDFHQRWKAPSARLLDRKSERASISRPGADKTAALLRITGVQFTAGARAPVRSSRRNGKVAARRMARFRGVGIACLANVAVIESQ